MIYTTGGYSALISHLLPEYEVTEKDKVKLDFLKDGNVIEAYDVQVENSTAKYWVPLTLETAVIAVDRNQTDMAVASWGDLRNSDLAVGIVFSAHTDRMLAAALCYGLEGDNFGLASAISLLEPLYQNGKLKLDDMTAPIQICFDSVAAVRIRKGENIEIIVPSEGTLSFVKGLLSNEPLKLPDGYEQILLEHGLRLPDSRCDEMIYPASERYFPAKVSGDYTRLNTIMQDWTHVFRREALHTHLHTSADGRERILFAIVFIIFAVIWVASMLRRSRQKNIRRVILVIGVIIAVWVFARVLKNQLIDENMLTRYLWYSYYFFQSLLPLGLVRIASFIGTGEKKQAPQWFWVLCFFNCVLAGLVMTNDLHGLTFKLDLSQPGWSATGNYRYGIIYYIVTAALLLQIVGGTVLMFIKIKHSPRRYGVIFPLIFTAALIIYIAGYALNIPFFAESDLTLVICSFSLLFLELCIRVGQIPINTQYRKLFQNAGLNMQIIDEAGKSVFKANEAIPLDTGVWKQLNNSDSPVYADENTLLLKNKISGGYAVWCEDVTVITQLRNEIETYNRSLESANALLSSEAQEKERDARFQTHIELYSAFEKDIAVYELRLTEMLASIPADGPERAAHMGAVAVLVCYIKRRCSLLALKMSGTETVPINEYAVYIDELAELARMAGVKCLTYFTLKDGIRLDQAVMFYDFFYSAAAWSITHRSDGMVAQTMSEYGMLIMKLMISGNVEKYMFSEGMVREIQNAGGVLEKKGLDNDQAGLFLSFPKGDELNA